jgi:hypothetical protein
MLNFLELQNNISQVYLLNIITKIFLNLVIFKQLKNEIKNVILLKLFSMINNVNSKNNNNLYNILYELIVNLYNIILFCELSDDNIEIDKENKRTQMDIILQLIQIIHKKFQIEYNNSSSEDKKLFSKKIKELNERISTLSFEFESFIKSHKVHQFAEQNKNILSDKFFNNDTIKAQIKKFAEFLQKSIDIYGKNNTSDAFDVLNIEFIRQSNFNYKNFSRFNSSENNNYNYNYNDVKKCSYCSYLNDYFKINFDFIYEDLKYEKNYKKFFRNLFLNFKDFRNIVQSDNNMFVWFLSSKESSHRIQNKFFLKENDIKIIQRIKANNKSVYNTYIYDYDKIQYLNFIKKLYILFLYDKISTDTHFFTKINDNKKQNINKYHKDMALYCNYANCLYIKKVNRTLSLLILTEEYILILSNLFIDSNNIIHVNKSEIDGTSICLNKDEYETYINEYITKNDENILNELFNQKKIDNNNTKNNIIKFGLDDNCKFFANKIYYKKISKMKKGSHSIYRINY